MGWKQEFGADFEVPGLIDYMVSLGILKDLSWHNDSMPSFLLKDASDEEIQFMLCVDHPILSVREVDENKRFLVMKSCGTETVVWQESTDDLEEAVTALLRKAHSRLPNDRLPHFGNLSKGWRKTLIG